MADAETMQTSSAERSDEEKCPRFAVGDCVWFMRWNKSTAYRSGSTPRKTKAEVSLESCVPTLSGCHINESP